MLEAPIMLSYFHHILVGMIKIKALGRKVLTSFTVCIVRGKITPANAPLHVLSEGSQTASYILNLRPMIRVLTKYMLLH